MSANHRPPHHLATAGSEEPAELRALRQAAAGLTYPSETDAPLDVFTWPAAAGASPRAAVESQAPSAGRKLEEVPILEFFAELEACDDGDRFRRLREILTSQLSGVTVLRVGADERRVDIYLLGKTASGAWAGLHTISVET